MFRSILKENNANPETGIAAPAFLCALFLFLVYLYYLAPDIVSGDGADLTGQSYLLGVCHTTGYPTTVVAGKIFSLLPYGGIPFRINLLSPFSTAVMAFFVILTINVLFRNKAVAIFGGIILGLSPVVWSRAESANVHAFAGAITALYIFLLILFLVRGGRFHFLAAMFFFGLSWTAHMQNLLHLPAVGWIIFAKRKDLSWSIFFHGIGLFALGLTPYLWMMHRAAVVPPFSPYLAPTTPLRLIHFVLGLSGKPSRLNLEFLSAGVARVIKLCIGSSLVVGIPLVILGLVSLWKRCRHVFLFFGMIQGANTLFFANLTSYSLYNRIIPTFIAMAVWIPAGMNEVRLWMERRSVAGARIAMSAVLVVWAVVPLLIFPSPAFMRWSLETLNFSFPVVDWRNVYEGREFIQAMEKQLPPNAVVVTPWTYFALLKYAQEVEGIRPDLHVLLHAETGNVRERLSSDPNAVEALKSSRPLLFVDGRGVVFIQ